MYYILEHITNDNIQLSSCKFHVVEYEKHITLSMLRDLNFSLTVNPNDILKFRLWTVYKNTFNEAWEYLFDTLTINNIITDNNIKIVYEWTMYTQSVNNSSYLNTSNKYNNLQLYVKKYYNNKHLAKLYLSNPVITITN
jgi:hypothetical protein